MPENPVNISQTKGVFSVVCGETTFCLVNMARKSGQQIGVLTQHVLHA